jgi:hypothetical protein
MTRHQRPGRVLSDVGAVTLAYAQQVRRLADALAGLSQLPLHPPAEIVVPVEPAELGAGGLDGELRAPALFAQRRPVDPFGFFWGDRMTPASAIFWIFQIIDMHFLPRWLKPTTAGWQPPARVTWRDKTQVPLRRGLGGRNGLVHITVALIVANRGAILAATLL